MIQICYHIGIISYELSKVVQNEPNPNDDGLSGGSEEGGKAGGRGLGLGLASPASSQSKCCVRLHQVANVRTPARATQDGAEATQEGAEGGGG